jgi:hypothetical protein
MRDPRRYASLVLMRDPFIYIYMHTANISVNKRDTAQIYRQTGY